MTDSTALHLGNVPQSTRLQSTNIDGQRTKVATSRLSRRDIHCCRRYPRNNIDTSYNTHVPLEKIVTNGEGGKQGTQPTRE